MKKSSAHSTHAKKYPLRIDLERHAPIFPFMAFFWAITFFAGKGRVRELNADTVQAIASTGIYRSLGDDDIQEFVWKNGALRMANNNLATGQAGPNHFFVDGFDYFFTGSGNGQVPGSMLLINPRGIPARICECPIRCRIPMP